MFKTLRSKCRLVPCYNHELDPIFLSPCSSVDKLLEQKQADPGFRSQVWYLPCLTAFSIKQVRGVDYEGEERTLGKHFWMIRILHRWRHSSNPMLQFLTKVTHGRRCVHDVTSTDNSAHKKSWTVRDDVERREEWEWYGNGDWDGDGDGDGNRRGEEEQQPEVAAASANST